MHQILKPLGDDRVVSSRPVGRAPLDPPDVVARLALADGWRIESTGKPGADRKVTHVPVIGGDGSHRPDHAAQAEAERVMLHLDGVPVVSARTLGLPRLVPTRPFRALRHRKTRITHREYPQ